MSGSRRPETEPLAVSAANVRPTTRLRRLLAGKKTVQAPGVFNPLLARLVERAGFDMVYISGAGLSNAGLGLPDVGLLTMTEAVRLAGQIARATSLPCLCDADTGYGGPAMIRRAVESFILEGVAGIHLEDQVADKRCGHLPGKELVPVEVMTDRIRSALSGRTDPDFVLVARTDARSVEGFDAALDRAKVYVEAGADAIFPEALESLEEFARFAEALPVPILANMTEFGKSPLLGLGELADAGVRVVLYPQTCLRVMMAAAGETLAELRVKGTQAGLLDHMQTRRELYDLLGYDDWNRTGQGSR
ncbi:MAG: methylisocitrate lyase [Candidatus Omnitrophica bacterium]|nr:methylisocitrate lyase [Candidatus Omnitrophota bacterium]